jgi:hypothetical protein
MRGTFIPVPFYEEGDVAELLAPQAIPQATISLHRNSDPAIACVNDVRPTGDDIMPRNPTREDESPVATLGHLSGSVQMRE